MSLIILERAARKDCATVTTQTIMARGQKPSKPQPILVSAKAKETGNAHYHCPSDRELHIDRIYYRPTVKKRRNQWQ